VREQTGRAVHCGLCGQRIISREPRVRATETDCSSQPTGRNLAAFHLACWASLSRAIARMVAA
jgi:hypothetical protein